MSRRLALSFRPISRGFATVVQDPVSLLPKVNVKYSLDKYLSDPSIDPIFKAPLRIKPEHGVVSCNMQLLCYVPSTLDFYTDFVRKVAYAMGISCSGMVRLPTKTDRWAVPKSPFIFKKCQEVFERKTHKRLIQFYDVHPKTLGVFLEYVKKNSAPGVGMRADKYEYEDLDDVLNTIEKVKKVSIQDTIAKPKLLADAIVAQMKSNPAADIQTTALNLHKELFKVDLPSLNFIQQPKEKTLKAKGKK